MNRTVLTRGRLSRSGAIALVAVSAAFLASCSTSPTPRSMVAKKPASKEYFAESEYGVKASPRVSMRKSNLPRGGGREQIGKPYKVRGKWYYPKEVKTYKKVGTASWYGDAFHGRLTANGEVYDMTHLTAAHPTMPLPSYARVTNTENGSSVIVRVNDRGPYSNGRIIDLSRRAAEMLDYTHSGLANVKVEYVGRAPLHGQDDAYLVASYNPGNRAPDPSFGLPSGVMIAMNGATPSASVGPQAAAPFPGQLVDVAPTETSLVAMGDADQLALPAFGPLAPERPTFDGAPNQVLVASAELSYAGKPVSRAVDALNTFGAGEMPPVQNIGAAEIEDSQYVAVGSFTSAETVANLASHLDRFGRVQIERGSHDGETWYSMSVFPSDSSSVDDVVQLAWQIGASDAFAVRD